MLAWCVHRLVSKRMVNYHGLGLLEQDHVALHGRQMWHYATDWLEAIRQSGRPLGIELKCKYSRE